MKNLLVLLVFITLGFSFAQKDAFPVEIEHRYGTTTISEKPERVIVVGLKEQDSLIALGTVPVGITKWLDSQPDAIWPWAQDKLGDAPAPELVGDSSAVNLEKVVSLQPDLIVALYSAITAEEYDQFSQIAPTLAQPEGINDWEIDWQDTTRIIGQALGQAEEAERLISDIENRFANIREEHPEFVGAIGAVATLYDGILVYGSEDPRSQLLRDLGFDSREDIDALVGEQFGRNISLERIDLLDNDIILWGDDGSPDNALYKQLAVHQEGREIFVGNANPVYVGAFAFSTILSLPYVLDRLVPQLAAAIDGDPETEVPAAAP